MQFKLLSTSILIEYFNSTIFSPISSSSSFHLALSFSNLYPSIFNELSFASCSHIKKNYNSNRFFQELAINYPVSFSNLLLSCPKIFSNILYLNDSPLRHLLDNHPDIFSHAVKSILARNDFFNYCPNHNLSEFLICVSKLDTFYLEDILSSTPSFKSILLTPIVRSDFNTSLHLLAANKPDFVFNFLSNNPDLFPKISVLTNFSRETVFHLLAQKSPSSFVKLFSSFPNLINLIQSNLSFYKESPFNALWKEDPRLFFDFLISYSDYFSYFCIPDSYTESSTLLKFIGNNLSFVVDEYISNSSFSSLLQGVQFDLDSSFLHFLCHKSPDLFVKVLFEKPDSIYLVNNTGTGLYHSFFHVLALNSPLHFRQLYVEGALLLRDAILQSSIQLNRSSLHILANHHPSIFFDIVKSSPDCVDVFSTLLDVSNESPFHFLISSSSELFVKLLLSIPRESALIIISDVNSPISYLADYSPNCFLNLLNNSSDFFSGKNSKYLYDPLCSLAFSHPDSFINLLSSVPYVKTLILTLVEGNKPTPMGYFLESHPDKFFAFLSLCPNIIDDIKYSMVNHRTTPFHQSVLLDPHLLFNFIYQMPETFEIFCTIFDSDHNSPIDLLASLIPDSFSKFFHTYPQLRVFFDR